jgi:hypothetical protein
MSEGTENQQGQQGTASQGQTDGQSAQSASSGQAGSGQAAQGANAAQSASAGQAGQPAAQTGQSAAGAQQSAQGQQAEGAQTQPHTPATPAFAEATAGRQAKGIQVKLTQEQIDRLLKDGTLELAEEHFTGAVRERMSTLTARAKAAERRLAEIAAAQEEAERKALEEQERYKELYEKERQAREKEASGRKDDAIRSRFLLAAQSKGIVDPDVAFLIAKALPGFTAVQVDDEGKVTGIDEVVEALVKEKPYLVSQPQTQPKPQSVGAASNPAQQSPPPPKNLAEAGDRLEQALRTGVT